MASRAVQRVQTTGYADGDENATPAAQFSLVNADQSGIPEGSTLIRSRLSIEFRIKHFQTQPSAGPLTQMWWSPIFCMVGLYFIQQSIAPGQGGDPIGSGFAENWVILDKLQSSIEWTGVDDAGNPAETLVFKQPTGVAETSTQRLFANNPFMSLFLCWNFNDPRNLINRSHLSFPEAYDLAVNWTVRTWWLLPATP